MRAGRRGRLRRRAGCVGGPVQTAPGPRLPVAIAMSDICRDDLLFEIELETLENGRVPAFAPISKFPSIRRDLAIVVDRSVSFSRVKQVIREASPETVRDIRLFDVYEGQNIESSRKSLALSLILQEKSRTLEDLEVQEISDKVLDALNTELGAMLRES